MDDFTFTCSRCGKVHSGLPDLSFDHPDQYHALTDAERSEADCDEDMCRVGDDYFVRGVLPLPVHGRTRPFGFGVWVSLSPAHFARYVELYSEPEPVQDEPWFGWLCNRIPGYADTLLLKTNVYLRSFPSRPRIELEPTEHQLAVEQRQGISLERLQQVLEGSHHSPGAS